MNASVVLVNGSWSKLGLVTDVNRNGLAFRYLDHKITLKGPPDDCADLKIIWRSRGYSIDGIPCRIIEDDDAPLEYSFSLMPMRKCRIAFGELTPDQKTQLDQFVEHFAGSMAQEGFRDEQP